MVDYLASLVATFGGPHERVLLAFQRAEPAWRRLDPQTRAKVLLALLAMVIMVLGLIALILLLGRRTRRIAGQRFEPSQPREDAWYRKPLVPREPNEPSGGESESTRT